MAKTATTPTTELTEREALVQAIQQKLNIPTKTAVNTVKAVLGEVAGLLMANGKKAGYRLPLSELAIFTVKATPKRQRKNPKTGEMFDVPAGTKIVVKLAKGLREVGKGAKKAAKK